MTGPQPFQLTAGGGTSVPAGLARTWTLLFWGAVVIGGLSGCRHKPSTADTSYEEGSTATPRHLFRTLKAAAGKADWAAFFAAFSPESQRRQLSVYLLTLEKQSQQAGATCHREFRAFLADQRIEPQPVLRKESNDDLQRRFANVASVPVCLAGAIAWAEKHAHELPNKDPLDLKGYRKLGKAELKEVALRGDRAIMMLRLSDGRSVQMSIRQIDDNWAVDMYRK